ncbi:MAG: hypothetical protein ABI488_19180 [Polyangiaceae bacterium]
MRALACGSVLLSACLLAGSALAQPVPAPAPTPPVPAPAAPTPPEPAPPPAEAPTSTAAPTSTEAAPSAPSAASPALPSSPPAVAPLDERHPATTLAVNAQLETKPAPEPSPYKRNYDALPLTLEARFGFNTRLNSTFGESAHEQLLDSTWALSGFLAWSADYAIGLEVEHAGLGRVRGLSGENSIDADYSATSGWLGARVFPWRSERWELSVNLRLGLAFQHVNALGTRQMSTSITVPPSSFSCSETDGPGLGIGGGVGAALRLSRHFSVRSRLDAAGEHLNGDALGSCADGLGSVASVSGTLGLAYEFETTPSANSQH